MDKTMRIAAAVVTYNRCRLLIECIEKLKMQSYKDFDIIIIDNASTDDTKEKLKPYIEDGVIYYNTGSNLGGAGGFNTALREAVSRGYTHIWIMDDDTMPEMDALEKLVMAAKELKDGWGFISGKAVWTDGNICRMNEQKLLEAVSDKFLLKCRQATFVSLFIPAKVVCDKGLPIKEFFIWGDDVEYTRRISDTYPSYYMPSSIVVHKTANNAGSDIAKDDSGRTERYRYAYRNEMYIARKEGFKRKIYQFCKICYHILKILIYSKKEKLKKIGIVLSATKEGRSFNPQIEYAEKYTGEKYGNNESA